MQLNYSNQRTTFNFKLVSSFYTFYSKQILREVIKRFFAFAGVAIFLTPLFQIIKDPILVGWAGYIFCYLFGNLFFVFLLSKASILTVTLLAVERWFSLIRPFRYKVFFAKKKVLIYVICILVLSAVLQIYKLFQVSFEDNRCVFVLTSGQRVFVLSYVIGTFVLPSLITWASFIHIWYRINSSPSLIGRTRQVQVQERLLLRMCAITASVLTVCWLPTELLFVLTSFQVVRGGHGTGISLILSMSNSIVNPWIYFLSNKEYRRAFLSIHWTCKKTLRVSPEREIPETDTHIEQENSV